MTLVQVTFGDPARTFMCPRCNGEGESPTYWHSPIVEDCPRCQGTGADPHPITYTYEVDEPVDVGDKVIVPPSDFRDSAEATVVRIGSDYAGQIRRARRIEATA